MTRSVPRDPLRLLYVESAPAVRAAVAADLRAHGASVIEAESGSAAAAVLRSDAPLDAVLIDPDALGTECACLLDLVARRPSGPPEVIVTSERRPPWCDPDHFIGMPPKAEALLRALRIAAKYRVPAGFRPSRAELATADRLLTKALALLDAQHQHLAAAHVATGVDILRQSMSRHFISAKPVSDPDHNAE